MITLISNFYISCTHWRIIWTWLTTFGKVQLDKILAYTSKRQRTKTCCELEKKKLYNNIFFKNVYILRMFLSSQLNNANVSDIYKLILKWKCMKFSDILLKCQKNSTIFLFSHKCDTTCHPMTTFPWCLNPRNVKFDNIF